MNSKKYFSNLFSNTLIWENLRRFWAGSLLAFLAYFFIGTLPIIMMRDYPSVSFVQQLLNGQYPGYLGIIFIVPAVAALLIYKYMQLPSATAFMNALPFSRKTMFNSNFLSGAILCIAPIILNMLLLMMLSGPTPGEVYDPASSAITMGSVYTITAVLKWALILSVVTLMFYAIAMFAATITGTGLLQFVLSLGFIFLIPAILLSVEAFNQIYMYGYTTTELFTDLCVWSCPFIGLVMGKMTMKLLAWYFICFLIVYTATFYLYKNRKMEKATDSITFNFMKPVLKYLITFLMMTLIAMLFTSFDVHSEYMIYLGALIGALIGYVFSDMVIQKTLKIKGFIKGFGIYFILTILFFGSYQIDLTGYEKRIPNASNIDYVYLTGMGEQNYYDLGETAGRLTDQTVITDITALHESLVATKSRYHQNAFGYNHSYNQRMQSISIKYVLTNGKTISRNYHVPYAFYANNENMKNVFEAESTKQVWNSIFENSPAIETKGSITINGYYDYMALGTSSILLPKDQLATFIAALQKDILEETFVNETALIEPLASAEMKLERNKNMQKDAYRYSTENIEYNYYTYEIYPYYRNTLAWLKEHGYYEDVIISAQDIAYGEVYQSGYVNEEESANDLWESAMVGKDVLVGTITDKEQLQEIIDTGQSYSYDYSNYYYVVLYKAEADPSDLAGDIVSLDVPDEVSYREPYRDVEYDKKVEQTRAVESSTNMLYFDLGRVPAFIKNF